MWNLKTKQNKRTNENKNRLRNREQTDGSQMGEEWEGRERKKVKGNIVNNSVITLHGDRRLLDLML